MGRVVRVRGAGAVGVARDDLLPFSNFVVHRVTQCARDNKQEENETTAKDEDAARDVETSASRDLWEQSISLGAVVRFVVSVVILFERCGRERRVIGREGARPGVAELRLAPLCGIPAC